MLVLDASAATAMTCGTDSGMAIRELLIQGDEVVSCDILRLDLADAMARFLRMRAASRKVIEECVELALSTIDAFVPYEEYLPEALSEATRISLPLNQLLYFCVARHLGATLVTTSPELKELCTASGVDWADAA